MHFTVLLVDDDANLLAGLKRSLHREQYRIITCTDAEQALLQLKNEKVDVLVSDEQMPGMNGAELLTIVNKEYPQIVNIMLSGEASMGSLIQAINRGGLFRFLIKPCSSDDMITAIRQSIAQKRLKDMCERVLPLVRRQSNLLYAIERKHPGICRKIEAESISPPNIRVETSRADEDLANRLDVEITYGTKTLTSETSDNRT
jgi:DNA-binding NtrC family response regulator